VVSARKQDEPEVPRITSAPEPLADDVARRQKRYLIQMGIRVLCFALAVLTWNHIPLWLSVVFIVGAVVLPYVAVILANAGRERSDASETFIDPRELGPGRGNGGSLGGPR
jgi:Flp pilus assembly protein TadB